MQQDLSINTLFKGRHSRRIVVICFLWNGWEGSLLAAGCTSASHSCWGGERARCGERPRSKDRLLDEQISEGCRPCARNPLRRRGDWTPKPGEKSEPSEEKRRRGTIMIGFCISQAWLSTWFPRANRFSSPSGASPSLSPEAGTSTPASWGGTQAPAGRGRGCPGNWPCGTAPHREGSSESPHFLLCLWVNCHL